MKSILLPGLFSLLLLSGCGFTLRGSQSGSLDPALMQMELHVAGESAEFGRLLQNRLQSYGVSLQDNALYSLNIGAEQSRERVVSVNSRVRAGEYELTLITNFSLSRAGEDAIGSEILSLSQIYEADPLNAAAKSNEAELIRNELRQALADRIIERLLAFSP